MRWHTDIRVGDVAEPSVRGIERLIFAAESPDEVRDWLDVHLRARLGVAIEAITFRAGDIGAVFGLRLVDGREVVLKALRPGAELHRAQAVVSAQNRLAAAGFTCPVVLDGPSSTTGVLAVVEQAMSCTSTGSPHDAAARAAMAGGLAVQIELLRDVDGSALITGRPAWANWDSGAWPAPHDSIFDFSTPVDGFEWLDRAADRASHQLRAAGGRPAVIGHSDWVWQNVCIRDGQLLAGYDWDSLVYAPESAIVGMVASSFTQGSPDAPDTPSTDEVAGFISDYELASARRFDQIEQQIARAAAMWVRCYNARCQLASLNRYNLPPPPGSFIGQLQIELGRR